MAFRVPSLFLPLYLLQFSGLAFISPDDQENDIIFGYLGSNGPDKWASLSPSYSVCSTGKKQSPVNIVENEAVLNKNLKPLTRHYRSAANATLVNLGFSVSMKYEGNVGLLSIQGNNYTLSQMHWHSPSEHRLNGVQYDAELHLVHMASDGGITVVGILYRIGKPDPLLSKLEGSLKELAEEVCGDGEEPQIPVEQIPVGTVDSKHSKRKSRKYYRYIGSLTTPPCTENVIWNVVGKIRSLSREQLDALKAPLQPEFKLNSRSAQPLNDRHVELYDELRSN